MYTQREKLESFSTLDARCYHQDSFFNLCVCVCGTYFHRAMFSSLHASFYQRKMCIEHVSYTEICMCSLYPITKIPSVQAQHTLKKAR
jgi:hypothetical protein